jgi:hypothetical protein
MAAEVSFVEQGITKERVSGETILGLPWRAWGCAGQEPSTGSPLPIRCTREKKAARDRLMGLAASPLEWVAGFLEECWWSRVSQPNLHGFSEAREPLPLVEQPLEEDEPAPKAISCHGLCICPIFSKGCGCVSWTGEP